MGGGLMQLITNKNKHDIYLIHKSKKYIPNEKSFFKQQYSKHTNFATETVVIDFTSSPSFGTTVDCNIIRYGDLLINASLQLTLDNEDCPYMGDGFIKSISLTIGSETIISHECDYMHIHNMLYNTDEKRKMIKLMGEQGSKIRTIPLEPLFKKLNFGIPLIALQYKEVRISITFNECKYASIEEAVILADYVYLDSNERRHFAQNEHKYLIEQSQTYRQELVIPKYNDIYSEEKTHNDIKFKIYLPFHYPCKELLWIIKPIINENPNYCNFNYSDVIKEIGIIICDRHKFTPQNREYYTKLQQFKHHTNMAENVYVYSFALNPEELQPSGSCNLSYIDNLSLEIQLDKEKITCDKYELIVYAINYNLLHVIHGEGYPVFNKLDTQLEVEDTDCLSKLLNSIY